MANLFTFSNAQAKLLDDTLYNNSVVMTEKELYRMVSGFDKFFGEFVDYNDTISGVTFLPIKVTGRHGEYNLHTTVGETTIKVSKIHPLYLTRLMYQCKINRKFNNFLDYQPYTKLQLYLPYLGIIELNNKLFMGKYLRVYLLCTPNTGECKYVLCSSSVKLLQSSVDDEGLPPYTILDDGSANIDDFSMFNNVDIVETYTVNIGYNIPLGSSNYMDNIRNMVFNSAKVAIGAASGIMIGGYTSTANTTKTISTSKINPETNRLKMQKKTTTKKESTRTTQKRDLGLTDAIEGAIDVVNSFNVSGNSDRANGSFTDLALTNKPILKRYTINVENSDEYLSNYGKLVGYPCGKFDSLKNVSGFTILSNIHIENIDAPSNEIEELENTLLSPQGIIIDHYEPTRVYPPRYYNYVYSGKYKFNYTMDISRKSGFYSCFFWADFPAKPNGYFPVGKQLCEGFSFSDNTLYYRVNGIDYEVYNNNSWYMNFMGERFSTDICRYIQITQSEDTIFLPLWIENNTVDDN